uniref:Pc57, similar to Td26,salivary lipocalin n=1 Tax=Panstrongylus chinai TaxID=156444 RepID=A0A286T345_9HEMI|nr:Pc57, similar to Td26,salivary lipocalin [Panstrongylus chinai]
MKTILAVIFLGILTFAFADYPPIKECKHPTAMEGFDLDKFMEGTWYVTNAKHGSTSTVCREYRSKIRDDNGKLVLIGDGYYTFQNQSVYFKVRCKKQSNEDKKLLIFNCTQRMVGNDQVKFQFPLQVTILSTDYNNFAVMYRCIQLPAKLGSLFEDNLLVLHRDATNTDDNDSKIKQALESQGSSLASLNSRKNSTCLEAPKRNKSKTIL